MDAFAALADPVRRDLRPAGSRRARPGWSTWRRTTRSAGRRSASTCGCSPRPDWPRPRTTVASATTGSTAAGLGPVHDLLAALTITPPFAESDLDGLDLEVRRVGRDRRAATQPSTINEETA